jgi:hypothetical protein
MDQFTPRVLARASLCASLRDRHLPTAIAAGLHEADLTAIADLGAAAAKADAEQQEQIASASVNRTERKDQKDALFAREDALRDRLPAVTGDLYAAGQSNLARWLERLTFARFRLRELAPAAKAPPARAADPAALTPPTTPEDEEEVRRVTRVEREDVPTRAAGVAAFCRALVKPGREPIVAVFAARGMPKEQLESIAAAAEALAQAGRNVMVAAEATKRETEAVAAQRHKWQQIRRMVRKAVTGIPELEKKYAEC